MVEIGCTRCKSRIRIDVNDTSYRYVRCTCAAVLVETRGAITVVYEFVKCSAVILS